MTECAFINSCTCLLQASRPCLPSQPRAINSWTCLSQAAQNASLATTEEVFGSPLDLGVGGAVLALAAVVSLQNTTFINNTCINGGGALYALSTSLAASDSSFESNQVRNTLAHS